MKRTDLDTSTVYAARRAAGFIPERVRFLDVSRLYSRDQRVPHSEPVPEPPGTRPGETASGRTRTGLLAVTAPVDLTAPTKQLIIWPRHVISTWDSYVKAEAAARQARTEARRHAAAAQAATDNQVAEIRALVASLGLNDTLAVSNWSSQRVNNTVLLTLLRAAVTMTQTHEVPFVEYVSDGPEDERAPVCGQCLRPVRLTEADDGTFEHYPTEQKTSANP